VVGLIVIVVVVVMIIKALAGGGGEPSKTPTGSPEATTTTQPATNAADAECEAKNLVVELASTLPQFGPADPVVLTAFITNQGTAACSVVPGAQQVQLQVVSGSDLIYETFHCADQAAPPAPEATLTIEPAATAELPVTWNVERTVDGCKPVDESDQPKRGREATYRAKVTVNGAESDETSFLLVP